MVKPKILITHPLVYIDVDQLRSIFDVQQLESEAPSKEEELKELIEDKDGVICFLTDRFSKAVLSSANRLKVISSVSAGVDHIDIENATRMGIYVTNTPRALTDSVAEFAIAILLAIARRVVEADKVVRAGQWKGGWGLTYMQGTEIKGKTVGIIGLGRIGAAIARKLHSFGLRLIYYSRTRKPDIERELDMRYVEIDDLLTQADFIIICVSLNEQTRGIIGAPQLAKMKKTAYLINISRGQVVDEDALAECLKNKRIAGAALDVFAVEPIGKEHPLTELDNVILTPHIGSATVEARRAMVLQAVDNIVNLFRGIPPIDIANPEVMKIRPLTQLRML